MNSYLTVRREAQAELTIEKSRFIAHVAPVSSKGDADIFFEKIRKLHRQATHNVPACVIGEHRITQWASDDGEPSGTSGAPILHMLVEEGLSDIAVVVTRYFGGVKLGTGGLVRAYTAAAKRGIEAAGLAKVSERVVFTWIIDYNLLGKIENLREELFSVDDKVFAEKVTLGISTEPENRESALSRMEQLTFGVRPVSEKTEIVKTNI
ncbi:MAG: YigZ family protein [Clostridiales Family XIII bacterium]|nr:YigZ family protein [Clostridiales Family XIII bacterium]